MQSVNSDNFKGYLSVNISKFPKELWQVWCNSLSDAQESCIMERRLHNSAWSALKTSWDSRLFISRKISPLNFFLYHWHFHWFYWYVHSYLSYLEHLSILSKNFSSMYVIFYLSWTFFCRIIFLVKQLNFKTEVKGNLHWKNVVFFVNERKKNQNINNDNKKDWQVILLLKNLILFDILKMNEN